jgi:hypothetical protein
MRLQQWALVAALGLVPAVAAAQTSSTGTTSGTATSSPAGTTEAQAASTSADNASYSGHQSNWIASGFVGSDFGASADNAAVDFGGSLGYLWNNAIGAEFLAGFTPNFRTQNNLILGDSRPNVNSYMLNAIGAVPLGADGQWQPFISGGLGWVQMRTDFAITPVNSNTSDSQFGGNIGAGVMGFMGIRGDVRYFRAFSNDSVINDSTQSGGFNSILPGLDFWRANIGVAFRF